MRPFQYVFFLVLIPVFMLSCKKGVEKNRYPLSQTELGFVPYQLGDTIGFIHSGGFEFDFQVVVLKRDWAISETGHPGEDYFSYEELELILQSNEPELIFRMTLPAQIIMSGVSCAINNQNFGIYSITDPTMDSLMINDKLYTEIFVFTNQLPETSLITFDSILYTRPDGIIKIGMNNEEAYYINN
jgi:hypothetical protein